MSQARKVLITGIAGKLGILLAERLLAEGHQVIGIDRRTWPNAPKEVHVTQADIRKRSAEDVFRTERPDTVIHMATVAHFKSRGSDISRDERHRINLDGTRAVFEYVQRYGLEQLIFIGRHTFYGAAADSPLYHTEDEPPMGLETFPELADLVAADLFAASALWRMPSVDTCVLRFCYNLGQHHHGTLAGYLRGPRVPTILGFDPLFQFMHEEDFTEAIHAALDTRLRGVYNVSGPAPLPLSILIREAGRTPIPLPEPLFHGALGRFGLPRLPHGAIAHLKYPIIMDSQPFREATGFSHQFDEYRAIRDFRETPVDR